MNPKIVFFAIIFIITFGFLNSINVAAAQGNQSDFSKNTIREKQISDIPFKKSEATSSVSVGRYIFAIFSSVLLGVILLVFIRKYYFGNGIVGASKNKIDLLEMKRVGPKTFIFVISYDNKKYLMAQTGDTLQLLEKELSDKESEHAS